MQVQDELLDPPTDDEPVWASVSWHIDGNISDRIEIGEIPTRGLGTTVYIIGTTPDVQIERPTCEALTYVVTLSAGDVQPLFDFEPAKLWRRFVHVPIAGMFSLFVKGPLVYLRQKGWWNVIWHTTHPTPDWTDYLPSIFGRNCVSGLGTS